MKLITCTLLAVVCLASVQANSLTTGKSFTLTVESAILKYPINALLKVWYLQTPKEVKLPLTIEQVKEATKHGQGFGLVTIPVVNHTVHPQWNYKFNLPDSQYPESTQIALELFDQKAPREEVFIGGETFTLKELKSYSHNMQFYLNIQLETIQIHWEH